MDKIFWAVTDGQSNHESIKQMRKREEQLRRHSFLGVFEENEKQEFKWALTWTSYAAQLE